MSYPTLFTTPGVRAFAEAIDAERQRQLGKFGDQHHRDGTGGPRWSDAANHVRSEVDDAARRGATTWRDILREEVFEALAESEPAALRTELVQVAAVCAAWIADLDSRPAAPGSDEFAAMANTCPAAHGALGRICELPTGHDGMHTGEGPNGGAVWAGDAS